MNDIIELTKHKLKVINLNGNDFIDIESLTDKFVQINDRKYEWSFELPGLKKKVEKLIKLLRSAMYPGVFCDKTCSHANTKEIIGQDLQLSAELLEIILKAVMPKKDEDYLKAIEKDFIENLTDIEEILETDIKAAYDGDPAAMSEREIMLAYPAFEAISIFRMAHRLYSLGVPLIPRMMTEYAHRITGIDIHPGAKIGRYFFIDHGTGVVIGETCTIGNNVKIYQGVTLGAKSFTYDEYGNPVKGIKRHPDIGNNVVIYAGATILGGDTVIGDKCIIGGNVWLTHSVEAGKKIFYSNGE